MVLEKGTKIRVIGGKHKGKWGHVFREMKEFSILRLKDYVKSKALGDDEDLIVEREVRAKNVYLERIPETVFEMPDEKDLLALGPCDVPQVDTPKPPVPVPVPVPEPERKSVKPLVFTGIDAIIDELKMKGPTNDDDLLSVHSDEDPVDITDILPSIDEALTLRHKQMKHKETVASLEAEIETLKQENKALADGMDLFINLADFAKNRFT